MAMSLLQVDFTLTGGQEKYRKFYPLLICLLVFICKMVMRLGIVLSICVLGLAGTVKSQSTNVRWKYFVTKKAEKVFEVHAVATIESGWHIYSQSTPEGGPIPTVFKFSTNPIITLTGNVREAGKLQKRFEKVFKVDVKYYNDKVEFIQQVSLKAKTKTNLKGSSNYMVCNDEMCLPPQSVEFNVSID